MKRSSGIIMHISSLPGKYGIGTFGKEAYRFVDFLKKSGQSYWQMLPLGQTGYGDSPYQSFSAFAGNPYFIDFEILEEEQLLEKKDYENLDFGESQLSIDYGKLFNQKIKVLRIAYENSKKRNYLNELEHFKTKSFLWIEDYAFYMALKEKFKLKSWKYWDNDIKLREKQAMEEYKKELRDEINFWIFIQYLFFKQWDALKNYIHDLDITILGDVPIYVAEDSADTWANPEIFLLDENNNPIKVAGCPPDAFSSTGQLWGNPIYRWDYLESTGYKWWINRINESLKLYDVIRIDHFRGFESFWQVPYGEETAINGEWIKGPGIKLFNAIEDTLGKVNIISEDLGFLTSEFMEFKESCGFPGMKVLQFAFDSREDNDYLPHNYDKNCAVYTGTHDNDTFRGWFEETGGTEDIKYAVEYLKLNKEEGYNWGFIRGAWSSVGNLAIVPMQDFLNLGNEARMNLPSTLGSNWKWRMEEGSLTDELAEKIYNLTKLYGRLND